LELDKYSEVAVTIFAYNRPNHLKSLLNSLSLNPEIRYLDLNIFIDGPKNDEDTLKVDEVKHIANSYIGSKNITVYTSNINLGLANSVINGVNKIFQNYTYQIVLEDDLIVREDFLKFMLTVNDKYKNNFEIAGANGYSYPSSIKCKESFFIRGADCWGWSTWKNRWQNVNWNSQALYKELRKKKLINEFNLMGNFKYSKILKDQIEHKIDSWAIRWHASMFLNEKYTVFPNVSLVKNTGFDGSGTHGVSNIHNEKFSNMRLNLNLPNLENRHGAGTEIVKNYYIENSPGLITRILRKFKHRLKKYKIMAIKFKIQ
jgi:hypothetical protein